MRPCMNMEMAGVASPRVSGLINDLRLSCVVAHQHEDLGELHYECPCEYAPLKCMEKRQSNCLRLVLSASLPVSYDLCEYLINTDERRGALPADTNQLIKE